ncbi:GTP-binding protein [Curtobacterium sp. NPDC090217]|uniref:GTP-binding protein n=1 Tax=unclassified Curtobacterium TaxID=257496 RepID=UPI00380E0C8B
MAEHVILFAGPMGAGKTTAIEALSEVPVVRTEAANTDRETADKATTTVALDYGEITVGDVDKVRLYGIPGQRRFDFMWQILKDRARGLVVLVNADAPDPVASMLEFIEEFRDLHDRGGVVVGVTRADVVGGTSTAAFSDALSAAHPEMLVPVFTVDPREPEQMTTVLLTLVANIEMRAAMAPVAPAPAAAPAQEVH